MSRPIVAALALLASLAATASAQPARTTTEATIDFPGFLEIASAALEARNERLLPLDDFLALAADPATVLLDTRSAAAYDAKHLAGAVHLSFSDLTEESLARTVGSRDRVVLIYCNNNFADDQPPFVKKAAPAALNIPTFATLWAYGYRNVYELGELVELSDPSLEFEGSQASEAGGTS